ncbi:MAG: hypothetical protein EPO22_12055 [Dehalococcoidia bacterium]|nr:MAG: hypothetical protein EPO22_12055 [Dehalococcoidia bacterium]
MGGALGGVVPGDVRRALQATRGGAVRTLDGGGDIVFVDYFDTLNGWTPDNADGVWDLSMAVREQHDRAVVARCVANALGSSNGLERFVPLPVLGPGGFELSCFMASPADSHILMRVAAFYNGDGFAFGIDVGSALGLPLRYLDAAGNPQQFAAVSPWDTAPGFVPIKMTFDLATGQYIQCTTGGTTYDLRGIAGQPLSSTNASYMDIVITCRSDGGTPHTFYWGHAILTANEAS